MQRDLHSWNNFIITLVERYLALDYISILIVMNMATLSLMTSYKQCRKHTISITKTIMMRSWISLPGLKHGLGTLALIHFNIEWKFHTLMTKLQNLNCCRALNNLAKSNIDNRWLIFHYLTIIVTRQF